MFGTRFIKRGVSEMASGYIKTFRKFTEWEWYRNTNTKALFLHCLLKANHVPKKWQGITIPQGSFVTSYQTLADELGLSVQEIRTAKRNIQSTGEITSTSTSKLTIITVLNWAKYQASDNDESTSESTIDTLENQQAINKRSTTTKNIKNERIQEEENKELKHSMDGEPSIVSDCDSKPLKIKAEKHKNGQFGNVLLTDAELDKIKNAFPIDGFPSWKDLIEYLSIHIEMKGYKAKSHYLAILKWVCNAVREEKQRQDRLNGKGNNYTAFQKGNKGLDIEVPWLESYIQSLKSTPDEKQPQKYGKQNLPEVEIPWLDEYWKETKTGGNS